MALDTAGFAVQASAAGGLISALERWRNIVGEEFVRTDPATLDEYSRSTLPPKYRHRPAAVVLPDSRERVRRVMETAYDTGVELHPISRGQNWGYGAAMPPRDGMVILDLRRMNRIVEVNAELGYAVVEPGVSQKQLADFLRENRLPYILDATGAGPEASLVGNVLQRGFGHTPYGNRILHVSGMEVVLRNGTVVHTGFGGFPNACATYVFPYGVGPWLDGVFTQSDLGVVTRMAIWLYPRPAQITAFALKLDRPDRLYPTIDALRRLRMAGVVQSTVHVANDLRVISARRQYPWEWTGGKVPLPAEIRQRLRRESGVGVWNLMGALYGSKAAVRAAVAEVRRAFVGLAHVHFFDDRKLRLGRVVTGALGRLGLLRGLAGTVESACSVYDLLCGIPSAEHLRGVYWRMRRPPRDLIADLGKAGGLWFSPVLPADGQYARLLLETLEPIFDKHGFEPLITMTSVTERALVGVVSVFYDAESRAETDAAAACYEELSAAAIARGFWPYRSGVQKPIRSPIRLSISVDD